MNVENLIPPVADSEKPQSRKVRAWRWGAGLVLGTTVAIIAYILTEDWKWFIAVPALTVLVGWSKLEFPATWLRNTKGP
jgi:hypothetical protein